MLKGGGTLLETPSVGLLAIMPEGGGRAPKAPCVGRGKAVAEGGDPILVIQSVERLSVMAEGGAPFAKPQVRGAPRRWLTVAALSPETPSLGVLSGEANGGGVP